MLVLQYGERTYAAAKLVLLTHKNEGYMAKEKATVLNSLSDLQDMDKIKKQARQSAKELQSYASTISHLAHEFFDIANDEISVVRKEVSTRIHSDPVKAVATAFVAGFLIRAIVWR
jgi:hypothetical protein